eukprot:snap_masked-scaffold_5-processed-gene-12.35-mRNA-1 protein AED:1.00 eAED:1.00 QI:0/0/0/0/1/1/3/0/99
MEADFPGADMFCGGGGRKKRGYTKKFPREEILEGMLSTCYATLLPLLQNYIFKQLEKVARIEMDMCLTYLFFKQMDQYWYQEIVSVFLAGIVNKRTDMY